MIDQITTLKPVITERSFAGANRGWYSFWVDKSLDKNQAAKLVEKLFNVKVEEVKSSLVKGKTKRQLRTRKLIAVSPRKKVLVRLAKDQKIDLFETGSGQK